MELDEEISCTILDNVYGGDGLARVDGRVVFVRGAFKGESVKARVAQVKKRFARADCTEVVAPSSEVPRLSHFDSVPGMVYAPIAPEAEARLKLAQLSDFLRPFGVKPEPCGPAGGLHYRNKVTYRVSGERIGYLAEGSHDIVDVEYDPLACDPINASLADIRRSAFSAAAAARAAGRRVSGDGVALTVRHTELDGVRFWIGRPPRDLMLRELTCGLEFEVPADGFYQVNPDVGEMLADAVRTAYLEDAGDLLDLYCGVGVFGLVCVKSAVAAAESRGETRFPRLVGVESGRESIAAARRNAAAAGIKANFFCERVGGSLTRLRVSPEHTVIVDPPRGGLEPNVAPWLARCGAKRIFYVSCDPATLARDLSVLTGGYAIARSRMFQMFPRTARFETFVELTRKGRS